MIVELVTLGSLTLTYKPPEPPPIEVGYLVPQISLVEPIQASEMAELIPIAPIATANTYEPGQCTWYVKDLRPEIPNTWGNASGWLVNAQADGWGTGSEPRVGAVGWTSGHVVLITAVNPDGTVDITDMNGRYIPYEIGNRTFPASKYLYIY